MSQTKDPVIVVLLASLAALLAVLIGQYGFDLQPCALCLYQRVPYLVVLALALAGLALPRWRAHLLALCALSFLANCGIALFHVGVEQHWWAGLAACSSGGASGAANVDDLLAQLSQPVKVPSCDQVAWALFGVSLAGYNLLASVGLAAFSAAAARRGWKQGR
jgi:disulfide bond formation protein DsbB